jgi:hypothetical protein
VVFLVNAPRARPNPTAVGDMIAQRIARPLNVLWTGLPAGDVVEVQQQKATATTWSVGVSSLVHLVCPVLAGGAFGQSGSTIASRARYLCP